VVANGWAEFVVGGDGVTSREIETSAIGSTSTNISCLDFCLGEAGVVNLVPDGDHLSERVYWRIEFSPLSLTSVGGVGG
jgi:hypothetical protein